MQFLHSTAAVQRGTTAVQRGTTAVQRGTTAVQHATTTVQHSTTGFLMAPAGQRIVVVLLHRAAPSAVLL